MDNLSFASIFFLEEEERKRERNRSGERYFCIQGWLVPGRDSKIFLESKAGWARNVEELPQVGDNMEIDKKHLLVKEIYNCT